MRKSLLLKLLMSLVVLFVVTSCGEDVDEETDPTTETCSDGIQNQDETGVDCGGVCNDCTTTETCSDGIQNQDETGVDCGGVCATCNDYYFRFKLDGSLWEGNTTGTYRSYITNSYKAIWTYSGSLGASDIQIFFYEAVSNNTSYPVKSGLTSPATGCVFTYDPNNFTSDNLYEALDNSGSVFVEEVDFTNKTVKGTFSLEMHEIGIESLIDTISIVEGEFFLPTYD